MLVTFLKRLPYKDLKTVKTLNVIVKTYAKAVQRYGA
jgi:hypothetical protein